MKESIKSILVLTLTVLICSTLIYLAITLIGG